MKKYDANWCEINNLLAFLYGENSRAAFDEYFLNKYGNSAPGELLTASINKVQKILDEAEPQ